MLKTFLAVGSLAGAPLALGAACPLRAPGTCASAMRGLFALELSLTTASAAEASFEGSLSVPPPLSGLRTSQAFSVSDDAPAKFMLFPQVAGEQGRAAVTFEVTMRSFKHRDWT
jgi:hypothetical protein